MALPRNFQCFLCWEGIVCSIAVRLDHVTRFGQWARRRHSMWLIHDRSFKHMIYFWKSCPLGSSFSWVQRVVWEGTGKRVTAASRSHRRVTGMINNCIFCRPLRIKACFLWSQNWLMHIPFMVESHTPFLVLRQAGTEYILYVPANDETCPASRFSFCSLLFQAQTANSQSAVKLTFEIFPGSST